MISVEIHVTYDRRLRQDVDRKGLRCAQHVVELALPWLRGQPQERFYVILFDAKHVYRGHELIAVGTLDTAIIHPRDAFRTAVALNMASVILVHNHPSGDPAPSAEDRAVTHRLQAAADILGLDILDHIIIADDGNYYSFRDGGDIT